MPMVIWPCGELVTLLSVRHLTTIDVEDMDTWKHFPAELRNPLIIAKNDCKPFLCQQKALCCNSQREEGKSCEYTDGLGGKHTNAPTKIPSCTDAPIRCAITPAAMMNRKISTMPPATQAPAQPRDAKTGAGPECLLMRPCPAA